MRQHGKWRTHCTFILNISNFFRALSAIWIFDTELWLLYWLPLLQSVRHTLLVCGPTFASAPPLGPRWQTRRRLGCALVARLRVLGYGPFWRPDIITPSKHYKYRDRPRRLDRGPDQGQEQTTEHHTGITAPTQPTETYCNQLQPTPAVAYQPIYQWIPGTLSSGRWGLSCPIILPRTAPALHKPMRTVHTWHQQPLRDKKKKQHLKNSYYYVMYPNHILYI